MNYLDTVQEQTTALRLKTILVAVDLSSHSERTVTYAISIARQFGASLKLIHVYVPPTSAEFGGQDMYRLLEKDRDDAETRLINLAGRIQAGYPKCEAIFVTGDPDEQVTRIASLLRADLIVVGRHHQTFLGRFFKLDQAPKILHRAACPVLVWEDDDKGIWAESKI
ncbi:MAG: universal stress protein [Verrucomicrobia bacterium]|nr:universal stress protein [Verrucomicrobiota bacterium]